MSQKLKIGFIQANSKEAIAGLTRKLPHYGKYGYLGFEGDAPTNNLKGSFSAVNSPLNHVVKYDGEKIEIKAKIVPRSALVLSQRKSRHH